MNFPRYKAGPVMHWVTEACTELVNGFIAGLGIGGIAGASTGVAASSTGLWSGADWITQALVPIFGMTVAALSNAMKQFIVWHHNHPFPNPWPPPTGTTAAPFEKQTPAKTEGQT